jgi:UDP-N-acetyl-D-galactosamine dehydrogenase
MGAYVANQLVKQMIGKRVHILGSRVLIMGISFKENCPDTRNSRVVDVVRELDNYGVSVDVHDPWVDQATTGLDLGVNLISAPQFGHYDAILLAVAHEIFKDLGPVVVRSYGKPGAVLYDLKSVFDQDESDLRL